MTLLKALRQLPDGLEDHQLVLLLDLCRLLAPQHVLSKCADPTPLLAKATSLNPDDAAACWRLLQPALVTLEHRCIAWRKSF